MRRAIAKNSARVVQLIEADQPPAAIYPDQVSAARIVGVSRQALSQAVMNGTRVKGYLWMKLPDYDRMIQADVALRRQAAAK